MKSSVTGLAIVGALLVIGGAARLVSYQSQQAPGGATGTHRAVRNIVVYKTPPEAAARSGWVTCERTGSQS